MRMIRLRIEYFKNREKLETFLKYEFHLSENFHFTKQSIIQCLNEIDENTQIIVDQKTIKAICANQLAFELLLMFGQAADHNSNIHILFQETK